MMSVRRGGQGGDGRERGVGGRLQDELCGARLWGDRFGHGWGDREPLGDGGEVDRRDGLERVVLGQGSDVGVAGARGAQEERLDVCPGELEVEDGGRGAVDLQVKGRGGLREACEDDLMLLLWPDLSEDDRGIRGEPRWYAMRGVRDVSAGIQPIGLLS